MGTLLIRVTQLRRFQEAGFDVQVVWECEIRQMMKNNTGGIRDLMEKENESDFLHEPLDP